MRASTDPQKMVNKLLTEKDISYVKAIAHGIRFENDAIRLYEKVNDARVEAKGLILHPIHNWLGASVDGFIGNSGSDRHRCLEIKCPLLSEKDSANASLRDLALCRKSWFLLIDNGSLKLKRNHKYFYQCQIQMACLEVNEYDFFVYLCDETGKELDFHCERIEKMDKLVTDLIAKAEKFYNLHMC